MLNRRTPIEAVPVAVIALVLTACSGPTASTFTGPAGDAGEPTTASRSSQMVTVPIRGTWDNTESPPTTPPPAGCMIHIQTSQVGQATHIGQFRGTGETCVTNGGPQNVPPFWDGAPAPPYLVADFTNEMVWIAANGDELWLRPNGGVFVMSQSNGAAAVRGMLTVAGGTGRFDGASGSLTVTGGREPGEPGDHLEYEGEITLNPGAAAGQP